MKILEIISELEKGAIITHTLPKGKHGSEYALEMGDERVLLPTFTFWKLRKKGFLTYAGNEGDISIYELKEK